MTLDEDRIAGDGLFYCVPWMKVAHARIRELEAQLSESEQHRAKNRETAVALQDEVTDLRMKLDFRDAHIESLQNKWASRPLSSEDQAKRIEALEAALKDIAVWQSDLADAKKVAAWALGLTAETPEAMHARIVTETADAIASQMETPVKPKPRKPVCGMEYSPYANALADCFECGQNIGLHVMKGKPDGAANVAADHPRPSPEPVTGTFTHWRCVCGWTVFKGQVCLCGGREDNSTAYTTSDRDST